MRSIFLKGEKMFCEKCDTKASGGAYAIQGIVNKSE
jgi:hypothetical protein